MCEKKVESKNEVLSSDIPWVKSKNVDLFAMPKGKKVDSELYPAIRDYYEEK